MLWSLSVLLTETVLSSTLFYNDSFSWTHTLSFWVLHDKKVTCLIMENLNSSWHLCHIVVPHEALSEASFIWDYTEAKEYRRKTTRFRDRSPDFGSLHLSIYYFLCWWCWLGECHHHQLWPEVPLALVVSLCDLLKGRPCWLMAWQLDSSFEKIR